MEFEKLNDYGILKIPRFIQLNCIHDTGNGIKAQLLMKILPVPGFATKCFGQENSSSLLQLLTSLMEKASWKPREALKWSTVWGCLHQKMW